jgi:hypothetical protein
VALAVAVRGSRLVVWRRAGKGEAMTDSTQGVSVARASDQRARVQLIELTHELPDDVPKRVLSLWNSADDAVRNLILALQALEQ